MTPIRAIQTSPAKANDLFARIADTTPGAVKTREALFADLKAELELIAQLERDHLLPVLRKHAGTKSMAPAISERLTEMKALLARIDKAPKEGDEFPGQVAELKKLFQQHLRDEKNELLPAIKKALSDEEVQAVADKVEAAKAEIEQAERDAAEATRAAARRQREQEEARQAAIEAAERAEKKAAAEAARAVREAAKEAQERADEAQASMRAGVDAAANVSQQAAGRFAEVLGAATDSGRQAVAAVQAGPILVQGLQEASQAWMGWAQGQAQRQVEGMTALMRCRTPGELLQTQSRLVRESMTELLETGARASQIAASASEKAARTVTA
ncbi:MAG TPA: hemerythrin domain-containing protein [Caulobacteraceae bacterium]|jgi:hemerythrin-like domain-containing protein